MTGGKVTQVAKGKRKGRTTMISIEQEERHKPEKVSTRATGYGTWKEINKKRCPLMVVPSERSRCSISTRTSASVARYQEKSRRSSTT